MNILRPLASDRLSLIVGLGKTGYSCARYLAAQGQYFAVADSRCTPPLLATMQQAMPDVPVYLGAFDPDLFCRASQLIVSPGVSRRETAILAAEQAGVLIRGDIDLFARQLEAPLVAITGSNAKSTVTSLLGAMVAQSGLKVALGGNLGCPAMDLLEQDKTDLYVLELSSFQLETTTDLEASVATILNITPDHMDRYTDLSEYHAAKQRIFQGCKHAVINLDDALTRPLLPTAVKLTGFTMGTPDLNHYGICQYQGQAWLALGHKHLLPVSDIAMLGQHNIANALAALALGTAAGLPLSPMLDCLRSFTGLAHRCQKVRVLHKVTYINDSKGTNVGATLAAINGLMQGLSGKVVLIAGGDGKGANFSPLGRAMASWGRAAVLIGRDGPRLETVLAPHVPTCRAIDLKEAVNRAWQLACPGDLVLFSPACASFDMYESYEQRGDIFTACAKSL
jgi:UDP-N-acetylmuramoylalanine--D-glutamate ligase